MTAKQRHKVEKGRRVATYAVYNMSHEAIVLPKNQIMGRCQLILQPSEGGYLQEMAAMKKEGEAEQREEKNNPLEETKKSVKEDEMSKHWVMENFRLNNNPILDSNPQVKEKLIKVLQKKGRAFEGGAKRDLVIGQGVAE